MLYRDEPFGYDHLIYQAARDSQVLQLCFGSGKKATQECLCGFYNHPEKECTCPPGAVQKYLNKISGPLLDRIDLHVEVTPVNFSELSSDRLAEKSEDIRN